MSVWLDEIRELKRERWGLHDEIRKLRAQVEDEKAYLNYLLENGWIRKDIEFFVRNRLKQLKSDWPKQTGESDARNESDREKKTGTSNAGRGDQ